MQDNLLERLWQTVKAEQPMVHVLSNIVTANDCANLETAESTATAGTTAKPINTVPPQEAAEITAACSGTVLNLGTPDDNKFIACRAAGKEANRLGHPLVIDPVGVGASIYRRQQTATLLAEVRPNIVRANLKEVQDLSDFSTGNWGVSPAEVTQDGRELAKKLALQLNCVVLLTGEEDFITDGRQEAQIDGGDSRIRQITGAGCMLSVLCGALATVTEPFTAACAASVAWKACAAGAGARIGTTGGMGAFHAALLDEAGFLGLKKE